MQFYSVLRPDKDNGLIPSTWMAPASSVYGSIADSMGYQIMVSSSIEDFGGDFSTRTDANTVPPFRTAIPQGSPASMRSAWRGRPSAISGSSATRSRSRAGLITHLRRFRDSPEAPAPTTPRTRRRAGPMPTTARCSAVQA